ncbi:hypothetical protein ACFQZ1_13805 [Bacillus sp. CGMCC 1.60114]
MLHFKNYTFFIKDTANQLELSKQNTAAVASLVSPMAIFDSIDFIAGKTKLHSFELVHCVCTTKVYIQNSVNKEFKKMNKKHGILTSSIFYLELN